MSGDALKTAIGIDIGGTFVKFGLVRGKKILFENRFSTAAFSSPRKLQEGLIDAIRLLQRASRARVYGVGIGIPGLVRFPSGVVRTCVNIPGWKDVPLKSLLQRRLHLPVAVDNDVNVMALAEWAYGAGRGVSNLLCMTLGTGVGGGLILDGKLFRGWEGSAGEIGHMPLNEEGPKCPCGGKACLERSVGNSEIIDGVRRRLRGGRKSILRSLVNGKLDRITPELIDQAVRRGDPLAQETWRQAGVHIGITLSGVVNLLNPQRIVIGGGISRAGQILFDEIRSTVKRRTMRGVGHLSIVPAALGSSAGLVGAALLVLQGESAGSGRRMFR